MLLYTTYSNLNFDKKKFQNAKMYYERDLQEPNSVGGHCLALKPIELNYFGNFQNNYYSPNCTEYAFAVDIHIIV